MASEPSNLGKIEFRPDAPEFLRDPFPIFRRLREDDPVHWSPRLKSWVLTRYDDIKAVCLDREISSDRLRPFFATLPGPEAERIGQVIPVTSPVAADEDLTRCARNL